MESHLIKIDTWEFLKGVFGTAFWVVWFIIKLMWPYLLVLILILFFFSWLESRLRKRKNKVGFKP